MLSNVLAYNFLIPCRWLEINCSSEKESERLTNVANNLREPKLERMTKCDKDIIRSTNFYMFILLLRMPKKARTVHLKHKHYSNHFQLIKFYIENLTLHLANFIVTSPLLFTLADALNWNDECYIVVIIAIFSCVRHVNVSVLLFVVAHIFECFSAVMSCTLSKTLKIDLGKLVLFTLIVAKCIPTTYAYNSFISFN